MTARSPARYVMPRRRPGSLLPLAARGGTPERRLAGSAVCPGRRHREPHLNRVVVWLLRLIALTFLRPFGAVNHRRRMRAGRDPATRNPRLCVADETIQCYGGVSSQRHDDPVVEASLSTGPPQRLGYTSSWFGSPVCRKRLIRHRDASNHRRALPPRGRARTDSHVRGPPRR